MTIEQAIEHAEQVANSYKDTVPDCECANENRQLAEWLRELVERRKQPEKKTGRWIRYDKRFPWRIDYKCSECGNYLDFSGVNAGRGSANFCPNCGADMRGGQNEHNTKRTDRCL